MKQKKLVSMFVVLVVLAGLLAGCPPASKAAESVSKARWNVKFIGFNEAEYTLADDKTEKVNDAAGVIKFTGIEPEIIAKHSVGSNKAVLNDIYYKVTLSSAQSDTYVLTGKIKKDGSEDTGAAVEVATGDLALNKKYTVKITAHYKYEKDGKVTSATETSPGFLFHTIDGLTSPKFTFDLRANSLINNVDVDGKRGDYFPKELPVTLSTDKGKLVRIGNPAPALRLSPNETVASFDVNKCYSSGSLEFDYMVDAAALSSSQVFTVICGASNVTVGLKSTSNNVGGIKINTQGGNGTVTESTKAVYKGTDGWTTFKHAKIEFSKKTLKIDIGGVSETVNIDAGSPVAVNGINKVTLKAGLAIIVDNIQFKIDPAFQR